MIYSVKGVVSDCHGVKGNELVACFTINGVLVSNLTTILHETFESINESTWNFKSGQYRDCMYLPTDYSNNAYVQNNQLVIDTIKDNPTQDYQWSGAFIDSKDKIAFEKGVISFSVKFPDVNNYHATVWMLGSQSKSNTGEIDIAESDNGTVTCNLHYYNSAGKDHVKKTLGSYNIIPTEYNTFTMIWTDDDIKFYCNNEYFGKFNIADADIGSYNSFRQPFYIVLNSIPISIISEEYCESDDYKVMIKDITVLS